MKTYPDLGVETESLPLSTPMDFTARPTHHCFGCSIKNDILSEYHTVLAKQRSTSPQTLSTFLSNCFPHLSSAKTSSQTHWRTGLLVKQISVACFVAFLSLTVVTTASPRHHETGGSVLGKNLMVLGVGMIGLLTVLGVNTYLVTEKAKQRKTRCLEKQAEGDGRKEHSAELVQKLATIRKSFETSELPQSLPNEERQSLKRRLRTLLSNAIQLKTVSYDKDNPDNIKTDHSQLLLLHKLLKKSFPRLYSSKFVDVKVINKYSLVFEWKGKDLTLKPAMLCAHLDVVPAANTEDWSIEDPFSGWIDEENDMVWGRGAIDNKHNVITQLAVVEDLLANGVHQLERTLFISCGHDEEVSGLQGASAICAYLTEKLRPVGKKAKAKGKKTTPMEGTPNVYASSAGGNNDDLLYIILDEGPFLVKGLFPGLEKKPIGLIGVGEKGNVSLKLSVKAFPPGHSSMPLTGGRNNIAVLSKAITRLEKRQFPLNSEWLTDGLLYVADYLPLGIRTVLSNLFLFRRMLEAYAQSVPAMAATMRTTRALTLLRAGHKINVVPDEAAAWINHRIHPSVFQDVETLFGIDYTDPTISKESIDEAIIESVIRYNKKIINDDRVEVTFDSSLSQYLPPAPTTSTETEQFSIIEDAVRQCFDAPVGPSLMIANTDTLHYWSLSKNIMRFTPIVFDSLEETKMFHGNDERVSGENLCKLYEFYHILVTEKL